MICLFIYSCFSVKASEEAGQAEIMRSVAAVSPVSPAPWQFTLMPWQTAV